MRTVDREILPGSPKVWRKPEVFRRAKRRRSLISAQGAASSGRNVGRFPAAAAIGRGGLGGAAAAAAAVGCRLFGPAAVTGPIKRKQRLQIDKQPELHYFGCRTKKVCSYPIGQIAILNSVARWP